MGVDEEVAAAADSILPDTNLIFPTQLTSGLCVGDKGKDTTSTSVEAEASTELQDPDSTPYSFWHLDLSLFLGPLSLPLGQQCGLEENCVRVHRTLPGQGRCAREMTSS